MPENELQDFTETTIRRDRGYHRRMRAKHIIRKKNICRNVSVIDGHYYPHDGMYSKGKIHCSCMMCSAKTRNKKTSRRNHFGPAINYKHSERRKISAMENAVAEYFGG